MDSVLWTSVPLAVLFWGCWLYQLETRGVAPPQRVRRILVGVGVPLACGVFLLGVLTKMSAADVRTDSGTILQYWALGLAWVGLTQWVLGLLGVSMRDDVVERRNRAAEFVIAGQLAAATCCFAGANIGNGPGAEVVLFCAVLATLSLIFLWLVLDRVAWIADSVTVERNLCTGIRAAGWFVATGIVLGAAVAGDWHSVARTLLEFGAYTWPMAGLTVVAALFERRLRKYPASSWPNKIQASAAIGTGYIALAVLYVYARGLS
jgi:hypothetical protein